MDFIKKYYLLFLIVLLAFFLRIYIINWDQSYHLHPDERMLIMVTDKIHFFDKLNPEFFNYGSLPIYLLKGVGQIHDIFSLEKISNYQGLLIPGRKLSVLAELLTIIGIYNIAALVFKHKKTPLYAAFLYAIAFFPIQNSHFFVVDVFLTCFTTYFLYFLLRYVLKQKTKYIFILGIFFAALITTKITAMLFYVPFLIALILIQRKNLVILLKHILLFHSVAFLFSFLFMPYLYLEFPTFFKDVQMQLSMGRNAYIFPYTLQYVGTTPYWYFIKNIVFWGIGPILSVLGLIGGGRGLKFLISNFQFPKEAKKKESDFVESFRRNVSTFVTLLASYKLQVTCLLFYLFYFLIVGFSEVKFMRYMLPIYPGITMLAAYGLRSISTKNIRVERLIRGVLLIGAVLWTLCFVNIYSQPQTRVVASEWILNNILPGSTIAIEHWDDRLPLDFSERYQLQELTLYDQPDNQAKWKTLISKLEASDYIIIASNRLYTPLQKLVDCGKYKACYPLTAAYYKKLFNGEDISTIIHTNTTLRFKKVAEFSDYPHLSVPITNVELRKTNDPTSSGLRWGHGELRITDDNADESFTVYDHPKIMIYKRI